MILVIDNYDSFTYNLVQYLGELGGEFPAAKEIRVARNDCIDLKTIRTLSPDGVVISPGPGRPEDAGISVSLIGELGSTLPILGVCLGHQSIAAAFGGKIISAPVLMHGKVSPIHHHNLGIFTDIETPFLATRYHSLTVDDETLPEILEVTARSQDDTIMGIRHRDYPHIQGVQFHPESILTAPGKQLLRNFLQSLNNVGT